MKKQMNLLNRLKKVEKAAGSALARPGIEALIEYFDELQREYNAPEAVAKREAEYAELQRIGELRRQDFYAGRDMDKCHPLPWAGKEMEMIQWAPQEFMRQ